MIESRFGETISLDAMAAHAGISRSHLSRIFPMATGYSISAYVRGRRLTEAAKALAEGAPDILGVAIDAGYGSHEAFTRSPPAASPISGTTVTSPPFAPPAPPYSRMGCRPLTRTSASTP